MYNTRLTVCMDKGVQIIILIRMRTPSSQLRLVEFCQRRWVGSIRDTEDVVHSIMTIPVLHDSLTIRCKVHRLQTFTLLVIIIRTVFVTSPSGKVLGIVYFFQPFIVVSTGCVALLSDRLFQLCREFTQEGAHRIVGHHLFFILRFFSITNPFDKF